jgi:hypothetical protein
MKYGYARVSTDGQEGLDNWFGDLIEAKIEYQATISRLAG